jgi:hypothetical protein
LILFAVALLVALIVLAAVGIAFFNQRQMQIAAGDPLPIAEGPAPPRVARMSCLRAVAVLEAARRDDAL